jgi:hypothetical protein
MAKNTLLLPLALILLGVALTISVIAHTDSGGVPIAASQSGYAAPSATTAAYPASTAAPNTTALSATPEPTTATQDATPSPPLFDDPTPEATAASQPTALTAERATVEPTPTEKIDGALICTPGDTIPIDGSGPPRAPFLVSFGSRIVGGGSIDPRGRFSVPLIVGMERAGVYQVTVRIRGEPTILDQFTCTVPAITPTPLRTRSG